MWILVSSRNESRLFEFTQVQFGVAIVTDESVENGDDEGNLVNWQIYSHQPTLLDNK